MSHKPRGCGDSIAVATMESQIEQDGPSLIRSASSGSLSLNELDASLENDDEVEALGLLRQIFPGSSIEELRSLHRKHVARQSSRGMAESPAPRHESPRRASLAPRSILGRRLYDEFSARVFPGDGPSWQEQILPHDFLRLPPAVAVRRRDEASGEWHYQLVKDLATRALTQHALCRSAMNEEPAETKGYYTKAIFRDPKIGLGLTLCELEGRVMVYSLTSRDGRVWTSVPPQDEAAMGPAIQAKISPRDLLIGINGTALLEGATPSESLLKHAVRTVQQSADPVVLHFIVNTPQGRGRLPSTTETISISRTIPSHFDTDAATYDTLSSYGAQRHAESELPVIFHSTPMNSLSSQPLIHPFVVALRARGFLSSYEEERLHTAKLHQLTERADYWESMSFSKHRRPTKDGEVYLPLQSVRKALCVRILNTFLDGDENAFTIWVYDVETGKEWYSPIRYLRDFIELRSALIKTRASISDIPFPKQPLSIFGSPIRKESWSAMESKCRQLESFLRSLCSMIYREEYHPGTGDVAMYLQSFLGCEDEHIEDTCDLDGGAFSYMRQVRGEMKRSIQRYTYRLFLLEGLQQVVNNFIEHVRAKGPRREDIEYLEAQGHNVLKFKAMEDLDEVKTFLDMLQDTILEGCMNDFHSIATRDEFAALDVTRAGTDGQILWDTLTREAVREQIEIEVYVPLRGVISSWLVNGWRHEDIEVQFKVRELRKRPQGRFRISEDKLSPSSWSNVCNILKRGVGQSTLPCVKLHAIVNAAREISFLLTSEHKRDDIEESSSLARSLGADDFLPIFIFCVVQAELDRPCALGVLLKTLCDPINRIGEIGYYVACYEAAITHIQELDLTEDQEEALSLLSVPLDDSY